MGKSSCMYWDGRLEEERQEDVRQRPARFCSPSEGSSIHEGAVNCTVIWDFKQESAFLSFFK